jgi:hypothetical protein
MEPQFTRRGCLLPRLANGYNRGVSILSGSTGAAMKRQNVCLWLALLFISSELQAQNNPNSELRIWKDSQGQVIAKAVFIHVRDNQVVLQKRDQTEIRHPLFKLSAADSKYVRGAVYRKKQAIDALKKLGADLEKDADGTVFRLELRSRRITNVHLRHLTVLKGLEEVSLPAQIKNTGLVYLKGLTKLKKLSLPDQITDAGLIHLKGLTNLESLELPDKITDAGLMHLKGLTKIKELWLPEKITDAGLVHLEGMTNLKLLYLGHVSSSTFAMFTFSTTRAGPITDAGLVHLKGKTKLETLGLPPKTTDAGLVHLKALKSLTNLHLDGTRISDSGLVNLKELTNLEYLNLVDTKITDDGLEHLKGLTKLKDLYLSGTRTTSSGKEKLRNELPLLRISNGNFP